MQRRTKLIATSAIVATVIAGGAVAAVAGGGGDDDSDAPLQGSALDRATDAALAHTGGGTVVETEVGDDGAAYGVEIQLEDGTTVEVNLDRNFDVIGQATDEDGPNDQDGNSEG
jgi:uncharacterized membrane protein YkoI